MHSVAASFTRLTPLRSGSFTAANRGKRRVSAASSKSTGMSGIAYDPDNIFLKIIEGKVPCYKIFETEHALAFLDAFPMTRGHALLIPKAKGYATVMDMPEDVAANVLKELPRLARAVKAATGAEAVNIVQNNGRAAGQVVFHAHFHVVPRNTGDDLIKLGGSGAMITKEVGESVSAAIKAHL